MFSIWDLMVNQVAGGFYISVVLLVIIFAIILAIGGVSFFSTMLFSLVFGFMMALGYSQTAITTIMGLIIIGYLVIEIINFTERAGG